MNPLRQKKELNSWPSALTIERGGGKGQKHRYHRFFKLCFKSVSDLSAFLWCPLLYVYVSHPHGITTDRAPQGS